MPCLGRLSRPYGRSCCTSLAILLPMCVSLRWEGSEQAKSAEARTAIAVRLRAPREPVSWALWRVQPLDQLEIVILHVADPRPDHVRVHSSTGKGRNSACSSRGVAGVSPSQVGWSTASRMTGMRLWIGAQSALGRSVNGAETAHRPTARWVCVSPWGGP
jgi:hypothetical protein